MDILRVEKYHTQGIPQEFPGEDPYHDLLRELPESDLSLLWKDELDLKELSNFLKRDHLFEYLCMVDSDYALRFALRTTMHLISVCKKWESIRDDLYSILLQYKPAAVTFEEVNRLNIETLNKLL